MRGREIPQNGTRARRRCGHRRYQKPTAAGALHRREAGSAYRLRKILAGALNRTEIDLPREHANTVIIETFGNVLRGLTFGAPSRYTSGGKALSQ